MATFAMVFACQIAASPAVHRKALLTAAAVAFLAGISVGLWKRNRRPGRFAILCAAPSALFIALSISVPPAAFPGIEISIEPDSRASQPARLVLQLLSTPYAGMRQFQGNDWHKQGDEYVATAPNPGPLTYRGTWAPLSRIRVAAIDGDSNITIRIGDESHRGVVGDGRFAEALLPEGSPGWKSGLQRLLAGLAVALAILTALQYAASLPGATATVFSLSILVASLAYWHVGDRSHAGALELVGFGASGKPAILELDAGGGFTQALTSNLTTGSVALRHFTLEHADDWQLQAIGGTLSPLHGRAARSSPIIGGTTAHCSFVASKFCLYELTLAAPSASIAMLHAGGVQEVPLPEASPGAERLFLLAERVGDGVSIYTSRATISLSPWDRHSGWVSRVRLEDENGKPIAKVVRVDPDSGSYVVGPPMQGDGSLQVPPLQRTQTTVIKAMAILAAALCAGAVILIACLCRTVLSLRDAYSQGRRAPVLLCCGSVVFVLSVAAVAGWPAIINWDGFHPYIYAQTGTLDLWYGLGYPLVVGAFLMLGPPWIISLYSLLLTGTLLLTVASWSLRSGKTLAAWIPVIVLVAWLPFSSIMIGTMMHLRDTMNGLLLAVYYVAAFRLALTWRQHSASGRALWAAGIVTLGALLSLFRADNIPSLGLVIVILVPLAAGVSRRTMLATVLGIGLAGAILAGSGSVVERVLLPGQTVVAAEKDNYKAAAMVNPLTGILSHGAALPEALQERLFSSLDRVMDARYAISHWSPYHIFYWHDTSGSRQKPGNAELAALRSLYLELMVKEPLLFLRLRTATFGGLIGHPWYRLDAYPPLDYMDDWLASSSPEQIRVRELYGFSGRGHPFPAVTAFAETLAKKTMSHLPQLIVLIIALPFYRRCPIAATIALAVLARTAIFYLFAPAAIYLYLYDVHLAGLLMPMLLAVEHAYREQHGRAP
ncbi:hypothetical protein [Cupriavidus sp. AU9028]|uniref:hypothetical protein n=1 Tax=Cupriavidus sp. AU9028 TaxID=2871157 RepID=UPI001C97BB62|nr:hypothetical protein [Cupriavidus sp. AU9028]MBY4897152.1 hypothetical protein [Cupriavidus sp. AU9028]